MRKALGKHTPSFRNVILLNILLFVGMAFVVEKAIAQEATVAQDSNVVEPKLTIMAFYNAKDSYKKEDNIYYGTNIEAVKKLLNKAKISYEIQILPWSRLIREAQVKRNSLIVSLVRTSEREQLFNWILRIKSVKLDLISRKDGKLLNLTKEQIITGDYLAVCDLGAIQCKMLQDFGFAENRLVQVSGMSNIQKAKLVMRGRVDFMIAELDILNIERSADSFATDNLSSLMTFSQVDAYLASGHNIDPDLLKKLQVAAKGMNFLNE